MAGHKSKCVEGRRRGKTSRGTVFRRSPSTILPDVSPPQRLLVSEAEVHGEAWCAALVHPRGEVGGGRGRGTLTEPIYPEEAGSRADSSVEEAERLSLAFLVEVRLAYRNADSAGQNPEEASERSGDPDAGGIESERRRVQADRERGRGLVASAGAGLGRGEATAPVRWLHPGSLREGHAVLVEPRHQRGIVLQLPDAGVVVRRGHPGHQVPVAGLFNQIRHRAACAIAINEVGDTLAGKVGVAWEDSPHPVLMKNVEVAGSCHSLSDAQRRHVFGLQLP